jgi:hypothetical protein
MSFRSIWMLSALAFASLTILIHSAYGFCSSASSFSTAIFGRKYSNPQRFSHSPLPQKAQKVTVLYMSPSLSGAVVYVGNKYYQLEEMEDKDRCITEIFLAPDKTITVGETDGPLPVRAEGTWEHDSNEDGVLKMSIKRTYPAGQPTPKGIPSTDIGEFQYEVERIYTGRMEMIGDLLGFSGSIHDTHSHSEEDATVGYFELIDTTAARKEAKM